MTANCFVIMSSTVCYSASVVILWPIRAHVTSESERAARQTSETMIDSSSADHLP